MGVVAETHWRDLGLTPDDIQTVENPSLGGALPINTNSGPIGEAYIHGMNRIANVFGKCRRPLVKRP